MELEMSHQERIGAPVNLVWSEMNSLEQILARTPQISDIDVNPGGQRAHGKARLAWGPVKWAVDLEVAITDFVPGERLGFTVDGPSLELHYEVRVELSAIGAAETRLDYHGALEVHHRVASRMRGLFNEIAEEQAHSFVHRVKVTAEQRRLAIERLLR